MDPEKMDLNDVERHDQMLLGAFTHTLNERMQGHGWCLPCLRKLGAEIAFFIEASKRFPKGAGNETTH